MTEATVILEVRHVRLAEQARHVRVGEQVALQPASLGDGHEGVFVALDDPPPVRTVLAVMEDGRRRALEVAWVVEVPEGDAARGFYGRWLEDDEALERAAGVGTEHLEDGTPVVQPVLSEHSATLDLSDAHAMAMPAPVMLVDDDTGVVDMDDRDEGEDQDLEAAAEPVEPVEPVEAAAEHVAEPVEAAAEHVEAAADSVEAADTVHEPSAEPQGASSATELEEKPSGGRKKRSRRRR